MVVSVDERSDFAARLVFGGEPAAGQELVLEGRVEALGRRVVQREPTRPIDWVTPSAVHAFARIAAEITRLRTEVAELRMERDVLKRSVVLWVKEAAR